MKKLKTKFNALINNTKFEHFIVFMVVFLVFIPISGEFSRELKDNNLNLLLSVIGASLAYAVFFISYKGNFIDKKEEEIKIWQVPQILDTFSSSSYNESI